MTSDWWAGKRGVRGFRRGGRPGGGGGIIFALARRFFSATAALLGKGAVAKWSGRALQKLEAPVQFRPAPPIYQSPPGGGGGGTGTRTTTSGEALVAVRAGGAGGPADPNVSGLPRNKSSRGPLRSGTGEGLRGATHPLRPASTSRRARSDPAAPALEKAPAGARARASLSSWLWLDPAGGLGPAGLASAPGHLP